MSNTKKGLLNENTIRRFMKLAEIDTLSDQFVDGLVQETKVTVKEQEDFDTGEEESGVTGPDLDDLDMADVEGPEGGDEASDLTAAVANLMDVISSMTGVEIDVDGGEEEEVELDVEDEVVMQEQKPGVAAPPQPKHGRGGNPDHPAKAGPAKAGAAGVAAGGAAAGKGPKFAGRANVKGTEVKEEKEGKVDAPEPADRPRPGSFAKQAELGRGTEETRQSKRSAQQAAMGESVARYRHALKQEVLRRVHGRIQQERHNDAVADQLSERILQRIKNSR